MRVFLDEGPDIKQTFESRNCLPDPPFCPPETDFHQKNIIHETQPADAISIGGLQG
jgi:hypothetical protein